MIGLVLLYFVGKAFYDLADTHQKSKWLFAILGVVSYYFGSFVGGIIIALIYQFGMDGSIENVNDILLSILALPVGVLTCWGFYKILQNSWEKSTEFSESGEVLDADIIRNQSENQN